MEKLNDIMLYLNTSMLIFIIGYCVNKRKTVVSKSSWTATNFTGDISLSYYDDGTIADFQMRSSKNE